MPNLKNVILCLLSVLVVITSCFTNVKNNVKEITAISKKDLWVEEQLKNMSLDEKIGQMLIVADSTLTADEKLLENLKQVKPGGFILFSDNFESYKQTIKLIEDISSTNEIPLFISIDQEGGRVQRLKELNDALVTEIPAMYQLGLTEDQDLAYEVGKVVGEELRTLNINMDFAPVLDIYSNPQNSIIGDRAFGTTAKLVTDMALSFSRGLESTGVIAVYKHFPGHGDTTEDSHKTLPIINKSKDELLDLELIPFINAIENGADVIMVGHLAVPQITGNNTPASLSKKIINDLLREELGFNGLVITDALNMDALTEEYTEEEIYINAINAGVDILLMPDFDFDTIKMISDAVTEGIIMEEEIEDSAEKILALKFDKLFTENTYSLEYLGSIKHQEIISRIDKILSN